ncbi:hypothetical protein GCM10007079_25280 [Nocardiopsis terrae]|nr:hypothetical protein GCM10007079_25280 [Nocardiopsis terrae]
MPLNVTSALYLGCHESSGVAVRSPSLRPHALVPALVRAGIEPGRAAVVTHEERGLANRGFRGLGELEKAMRSHLRSVQKRTDLLRGFIDSVGLEPSPFPSTA